MHECLDCGHIWDGASSIGETYEATQCPGCNSYRTQPSPVVSDMGHDLDAMPTSTQDDMSGNPLKEGILADNGWKPNGQRDEFFSSTHEGAFPVHKFHSPCPTCHGEKILSQGPPVEYCPTCTGGDGKFPRLDAPGEGYQAPSDNANGDHELATQFKLPIIDPATSGFGPRHFGHEEALAKLAEHTFDIVDVLPPDELAEEAKHRANIQIPNGISDNLHTALGNLKAWVENPYENGQLRPYHNQYWKSIRPAFMSPGAIQIGVTDPTMAEIINHVAQTDDLSPVQEYRQQKTAGPAAALLGVGGAGAGAAGAAGAAGSAGGIGGLMSGAMSVGRGLTAVNGLASALPNGSPGYGTTPTPTGMMAAPNYYSHTAADDSALDLSHGEIPVEEDGDSQQHDVDDNSEWQHGLQDELSPGGSLGFKDGGPGLERFMMLLPLVLHYFNSDDDGSHDPLLQGLDECLEQELPGYKDHGDEGEVQALLALLEGGSQDTAEHEPAPTEGDEEEAIVPHTGDDSDGNGANHGGKHEAAVDFLPDIHIASPGIPGFTAPVNAVDVQNTCPRCAAVIDPSMQQCAQCTSPLGMQPQQAVHARTAGVGPHTPEQISAVISLLIEQQRYDEAPLVATNPEQFVEELSQITGRDGLDPNSDTQGGQPEPAMEEAPPGATMPMPGMDTGQQMMAAVRRYSEADGGHFDPHAQHGPQDGQQAIGLPAADQDQSDDLRQQQDSGHTWVDEQGNPLRVGDQYEMHSQKYDIPDLIRIEQVKPDALTYTLVGEYGMEHSTEVNREEAEVEGYTFSPASMYDDSELGPPDIEQNDDDNTGYQGETSDPSQGPDTHNFGLTASRAWLMEGAQPEEGVGRDWLMPDTRTAGAKFTPMEQREFIEERGVARNSDKLDLAGTHYDDAHEDQFLFGL